MEEKHKHQNGDYIGDFVYGALDGVITTFAIVAGVAGAALSPSIVLILGFANLLADGISMGVGNYLSTKSELEFIRRQRKSEEEHVVEDPAVHKKIIKELYARKGFSGSILDGIVKTITGDKKLWVDTLVQQHLELGENGKHPFKSGLATFVAFVLIGFIPLLAYVVSVFFVIENVFAISCVLTAAALFLSGAARSFFTGVHWFRAGMEMLIVGGLAAGVAFLVGWLLRGLV